MPTFVDHLVIRISRIDPLTLRAAMMGVVNRFQCELTDITLIPLIVLTTLRRKVDAPRQRLIGSIDLVGDGIVAGT
jgi:hypothetical protein